MIKRIIFGFVWILIFSSFTFSNATSIDKIQGVYVVDKASLIKSFLTETGFVTESVMKDIQTKMREEGTSFELMANLFLANTIIEFDIKGDSINGILSIDGKTSLIKSHIIERNGRLVVKGNQNEAYLIPIEKGLLFRIPGSKLDLRFLKTDRKELSFLAKEAIQKEREKEEFEQNLGKWQKENYIDEFGDNVGEYSYVWLKGIKQSSNSNKDDIYIKVFIENEKLIFKIYSNDLEREESLPDKEYGIMKLKFPDGTVESEKIYFKDNSISESGDKTILFDYISDNSGLIKVLIDLNTADSYYFDKYIFSIEKNNLTKR